MLNSKEIIDRIQNKLNLKNDAEIARLFNFHQANIRNWRKRNTIAWQELYDLCEKEEWSFDWLLTGKEAIMCDVNCSEEQKILGRQAIKVLNSKTEADYAGSLRDNIRSFYMAVINEEKYKEDSVKKDKRIAELERKVDYLMELYNRETKSDT